jgi:hypothetical protein
MAALPGRGYEVGEQRLVTGEFDSADSEGRVRVEKILEPAGQHVGRDAG